MSNTVRRNPYAKALSDKLFNVRIVKAEKGKGAYNRKQKNYKKDVDSLMHDDMMRTSNRG